MKLKLMDIENFIKINNLKPVSSIRIFERSGKLDPSGLFSEEIFGRLGSMERRRKFAYIDLKCEVIHPEAIHSVITGLDPNINKLIWGQSKYLITDDGKLIEDKERGESGVYFFTKIFRKLDLNQFKKSKPEIVKFIKENIDKIFINKYIVLPAGIRDLHVSKTTNKVLTQFSDLSSLYENLIKQSNAIPGHVDSLPEEIASSIVVSIQRTLLELNEWIKSRIKGKQGIIKGGLLRKAIDNTGRFVVTSDPTLPLGYIGLPWQSVLKLFEPFAIHQLLYKDKETLKLIQDNLKLDKVPSINEIRRFFGKVNENPNLENYELKDKLFGIAREIVKGKQVLYKRDPVENRDSYLAAFVRVDPTGYVMKLSPFDLPRTGGDHDGDTYAVYALFTKESQEEAKHLMNPRHSPSMWTTVTESNKCPYQITLDAAVAIYAATKQ